MVESINSDTVRRTLKIANTRAGYLLTLPDGVSDDSIEGLKSDIETIKGGIHAAGTTSGGHGKGNRAARQADLDLKRLGATFPESSIGLRRGAGENVLVAMGIASSLFSGTDGAIVREGFHRVLVSCLQPLTPLNISRPILEAGTNSVGNGVNLQPAQQDVEGHIG